MCPTHVAGFALIVAICLPVAAEAVGVGDDVLITLNSGAMVRGVVIATSQNGYQLRTTQGVKTVAYTSVQRIEALNQVRRQPQSPVVQPLQRSAPIPARPRRPSKGKVATGWILFGVGELVFITGLAAFEARAEEAGATFVLAGVVMANVGLTLAIIGHVQRAIQRGKIRRWERKYGNAASATGLESLRLVPTIGARGESGLAVNMRF